MVESNSPFGQYYLSLLASILKYTQNDWQEMDSVELLGALKTLADETRLKLIGLLLTHDLCVGALAQWLGISEAAVSQHLRLLRKCWTGYR